MAASGGGASTDDAYAQYDCGGHLWRRAHSPVLFADGGNFLLGISRVASFLILYALNSYNRKLLLSKTDDNTNVIPNLILPYYFTFFKIFIFVSFVAGVLDLAIQLSNIDDGTVNNWLVPLEQGFFHWLYEGLAFFLMRYGSGLRAMKLSLFYSSIWGCITFVIFFVMFSMLSFQYGFKRNSHNVYSIFMAYDVVLLAFYTVLFVTPDKYLYRRKALRFYAGFNIIYYSLFILMGTLLYEKVVNSVCAGSILIFIFVGFLQPVVLFKTLQIDSQYWQGLTPDPRNPMLSVWDHVDISTAQSMAENMDSVSTLNLPVLHFGLLEIEKSDQFIPGGFSRVYFGSFRKEKVALKILFAMELTPQDVDNFYAEATLLHSLQHPNVVECKGICTMPPALAMVLENCENGSLFDFLYKPVADENLRREILHQRSIASSSTLASLHEALSSGPPSEEGSSARQSSDSLTSNKPKDRNASTENKQKQKSSSLVQALSNRLSLRNSFFRPSDIGNMNNDHKEQELTPSSLRDSHLQLRSSLHNGSEHDGSSTHNPIVISVIHHHPPSSNLVSERSSKSSTPTISVDSVESSTNLRASTMGIDISTFQHHAAITGNDRLTFAGGGIAGDGRGQSLESMEEGVRSSQLSSIDMDSPPSTTHTPPQPNKAATPMRRSNSLSSYSRFSTSNPSGVPLSYAERSSFVSPSRPSMASRALGSMANFVSSVTGRQSVRLGGGGGIGQGLTMLLGGGANERDSVVQEITLAHRLTMQERIVMMRDAIAGIAFLHSHGFLHCDIKSLNFLVDKNYRVKVADLGEARRISALAQYEKPPSPARNWIPPEIVPKHSPPSNYTLKSEVYAVCIVIAELALLELPFGELPERVTLRTWHDKLVIDRIRPMLPVDMPSELRALVELGMETEPDMRPTMVDLHAAFEEYAAATSVKSGSASGTTHTSRGN
jgi:serine/threonine protein kinase